MESDHMPRRPSFQTQLERDTDSFYASFQENITLENRNKREMHKKITFQFLQQALDEVHRSHYIDEGPKGSNSSSMQDMLLGGADGAYNQSVVNENGYD